MCNRVNKSTFHHILAIFRGLRMYASEKLPTLNAHLQKKKKKKDLSVDF